MTIERPLRAEALLVEAVRAIEASRRRIAVVTADDGLLIGTLTDGDIRRCLLAGGSLETPVAEAMNTRPMTALDRSPNGYLLDLMRRGNVLAVPLIDAQGHFVRLVHLNDLVPADVSREPAGFGVAVIMAGGEGRRLRPLTESIPKPMVDIGGMPLLERQIQKLAASGVRQVYLSVNYLSHIIEDHFGDGSAFGLRIDYLREGQKLGTGGALSLLPEIPAQPIVVMNGDILTTSDFRNLHAFHHSNGADVTVAAIDYRIDIPFGVIHAQGPFVSGLAEKPSQRFLCNAGIYAVSPQALQRVPANTPFHMTDLIEACLAAHRPVAVFPVHEYWSDIGTPADLEQARRLFGNGA